MKFEELSKEAQLTAIGMMEQSILNENGMGMDGGIDSRNRKRKFRKELEVFVLQYDPTINFDVKESTHMVQKYFK